MPQYLDARYRDIAPYTPGEQPVGQKLVKLNTNECPYPPAPAVAQAVYVEAQRLNLYSDPSCAEVIQPLAHTLGVTPQQVFVSNGSDETLAFLFQAFCPNGAAFADITYGFYPVYCHLYGVDAKIIPLREDFTLAPEEYYGLNRTIFIANPNAPTGLALSLAQIEQILQENTANLVVIDEAYVDFGAQSAIGLLSRYPNLVVVGTFSKSRAMAGARLGYAVASAEVIQDINRIKFSFNPYNVNRMTLAAGAATLANPAYFEECRQKVIATRQRIQQQLVELGWACTQSSANFLFAKHPSIAGQNVYIRLRQQGILVRWFNLPRIQNWLRISIGTDDEMDMLVQALRAML